MTPDRIAWYRQWAVRYSSPVVLGFHDIQDVYDFSRLAAHFGRLALEAPADAPPLCDRPQPEPSVLQPSVPNGGDSGASYRRFSNCQYSGGDCNDLAATERIAALEGALEQAIVTLEAAQREYRITDVFGLVPRLRAVLGKDG